MKKFRRIFALLMCVVLTLSLTACRIVIDGEENVVKKPTAASGTIGLSVSTLNNPFFVTLAEGAEKAAAKAGVQISVVDAGDDVTKQVSDIEDLVSKGISVLIVNPCDSDAVTGAVEAAKAKGVKVIAVDRAVNGVEIDCQIASDNVLGAELATQYIVDKLGEGVKVAELEGVPGASAAIDRSAGFHNVADKKLDVVAKQTANFDRAEGMSVMENMLQANGDIKAVFAANDEMALGALEAIAGAGKDVMVMGFDATDDAIEAIKAGRMHGTIAQQPALIGSTAVDNAIKLMAGETIAKSIPVEVTLVTAENVDAYAAANTPVEIVGNGSIGLSVSTLNNPFFVDLAEGAEKAAAKAGVAISVVDAGDDVTKQVSDVEDLVAKGISVLIINPCDSDAVTGAVEAAMAKGVHVIAVDRAVNGVTIACQIASDNVLGAELATQYIVDTLGEGVKVAELEGVPGASAAIDRSAGFHNVADAKLDVVAKQTANFDRAQGMSVMENMLQANGDIKAVFAANDEMALGAVEAIAGAGKDIMVMGFDATDDALAAIREGRMAGTIAQQPALIGSTAVDNAVELIGGTAIPASIPVAVTLVTAENVDTYNQVAGEVEIVGNGSIGLSVSTLNNPFFVDLAEGAEKAAADLGIAISVVDAGDDVTKQVSDVEDLVAKGISVLIINPCDSDAVTGAVEAAMAQGVRVIAVDRAVNGVTIDCQIASDNVLGAELATQYIVDTLGKGVKVAELEGVPGASAAIDRSAGFHNVADANLDVVAKQTANFDRAQGMSVMENMLQANGGIQAVFAANDEMALGAVEAIAGAGKDIMVMGFDATDDALAAIREGRMAGTIAQQPALIGSTAVENAATLISGTSIPASIPVEVTLVTAANVDTYANGADEEVGAPVEIVGNGSIGLSVSTLNNPFFVDLAEGAEAAAAKLGVKISVVDAGDDVTKQVSDVEDLIAKGISVLIINPCDSDAVTGAVEAAMAQGVRVIAVDRAVNGVEIDCQIASDNVLGAELATQYIVDTLGKGVKVAELEGVPGASAAIDRSAGFHNVADKDLNVVAKQTANFDRTQGMSVMENMLQAHGDIQAVFAANDEMALGAVEAIAGAGKDIMVMGFDATDDAIAAIKEGRMAGTIAQQPALIGSTAVENAHKLISGKGIPASIPVEVALITIENAK